MDYEAEQLCNSIDNVMYNLAAGGVPTQWEINALVDSVSARMGRAVGGCYFADPLYGVAWLALAAIRMRVGAQ